MSRAFGHLVLIVGLGVASLALAQPSHERIDGLLEQPVSITMTSGERLDGGLYKRSEGHVVFKGNDGTIRSFAIRDIAHITLLQDLPSDTEDRAEHTPDESAAQPTTEQGELIEQNEVLEGAPAAENLESMDEETLLEHAEGPHDDPTAEEAHHAEQLSRNEPLFHAIERYTLEEELKDLQHKQALKREVDRTSRGLIIGGATVIGAHVVFQGLLLIPMFSDGGMTPRTAKILSGVNIPFVLLGGSLLAAGLVQRHKAQQEFQQRYNFSVAPTFHTRGGGAQFGMTF